MKIIDIHTHILYGLDDGAEDLAMSMELIKRAYEQGVRGLFLTNHGEGIINRIGDYRERFKNLKMMAEITYPGLELFEGSEVVSERDNMVHVIDNLNAGNLPTLNGTKYVLTEFVPYDTDGMKEVFYCVDALLNAGYIPVIAHVERYADIYSDPAQNLHELKEKGCFTQVNLYSVKQDHGMIGGGSRKKLANLFLKDHLIDFVGTDSHRIDYKSPEAAIGAQEIEEKYGADYAKQVLYKNAERLLTGV